MARACTLSKLTHALQSDGLRVGMRAQEHYEKIKTYYNNTILHAVP